MVLRFVDTLCVCVCVCMFVCDVPSLDRVWCVGAPSVYDVSCGVRQWYQLHRAAGTDGKEEGAALAWYWQPSEWKYLTLHTRSTHQSSSAIYAHTASVTRAKFAALAGLHEVVPAAPSWCDNQHLSTVPPRRWSLAEDHALVRLVTVTASRLGCDAVDLTPVHLCASLDTLQEQHPSIASALARALAHDPDVDAADAATAAATAAAAAAAAAAATTDDTIVSGAKATASSSASTPAAAAAPPSHTRTAVAAILIRVCLLRVVNLVARRALPLISLSPHDDPVAASPDDRHPVRPLSARVHPRMRRTELPLATRFMWSPDASRWHPASVSAAVRARRFLFFSTTKRQLWNSVVAATTTPTPLAQDEYEDPADVRSVRITRGPRVQPKALAKLPSANARLARSIFGQLFTELHSWGDSSLRRAYVGKGHGGQKRAFKVDLLGEGVNDYGGPYRAVFESLVTELQSEAFGPTQDGHACLLPFLLPSPNRASDRLMAGDAYVFNPGTNARTVPALRFFEFLGKMVGMGVRHGMQLGLRFPPAVWRSLAGLCVGAEDLYAVDTTAPAPGAPHRPQLNTHAITASDGVTQLLLPGAGVGAGGWEAKAKVEAKVEVGVEAKAKDGAGVPTQWDTAAAVLAAVRLRESEAQIAAFAAGLRCVLPAELLHLMTPEEIEELVCGFDEVDVGLLKQVAEYDTGVDPDAPHVQWLWEVLEEASPQDRTEFLTFVWARSRMPPAPAMFPMPFKIKNATHVKEGHHPDQYLPHAATCFFSLSLPAYSSKEMLRQRLMYAVKNSPNMDADVRLHSAEGWAGI